MNDQAKPKWQIVVNDHGCYTQLDQFGYFDSLEECTEKITELKKLPEWKKGQLIPRQHPPNPIVRKPV